MDTRLLRTFMTVVQRGSFSAAAASLGYTQSAVSQHVSALESSLGVRLLERRPFGVTPAGARLAEHAANILVRWDVAASEVTSIDRRAVTALVATPLAAATDGVVHLLAAAQALEGASMATLCTAAIDEVVARVARDACSAGVVDGIVGRADPLGLADPGLLTSLLVRTSALAVVMPDDHPFAARDGVSWTAVADAQWVEAPNLLPHLGPGAAEMLGVRRGRSRYDGSDPAVLVAMVAAGHGLALMPVWWTAGSLPSHLRAVPLADPALVHRVEVLVLRPRADAWTDLVARAIIR